MDELDFIDSLRSEKTAGVKDQVTGAAKAVAKWVKTHPHQLAGMGIGGGLAGVGAYLASKPGKDGLSAEQKLSRSIDKKVPKDSEGFLAGLGGVASKTHKEVADLAAKHPKMMALTSIPIGAAAGRAIANKLKEGSAMPKGLLKKLKATNTRTRPPLDLTPGGKGHIVKAIPKRLQIEKKAALEIADQWGRELAHEEAETQERLYTATEKLASGWTEAGKMLGSAGKHVMKTPAAKRALIGAGVGVGKNLLTSNDNSVGSMAGDAVLGAGAGLGARQGMKMLSGMKGKGIGGKVGQGVRAGLKGK